MSVEPLRKALKEGDSAPARPTANPTRGLQNGVGGDPTLAESPAFRPIQYLGSKMRLLPVILDAIESVGCERSGSVCDLFSGSGVVAHALAARTGVVAVDIQEYSRVLASGLLLSGNIRSTVIEEVATKALLGEVRTALMDALRPLLTLEAVCYAEAQAGEPERLDEFINRGSLMTFQADPTGAPKWLASALSEALVRIDRLPATIRAQGLMARMYGGPYYSIQQAIDLDALRAAIRGVCSRGETDACLGVLLSTASSTVNTVGKQFAQPIRLRKRDGTFRKILVEHTLSDRSIDVVTAYSDWGSRWLRAVSRGSEFCHRVVRDDYMAFLKSWQEPMRAFYVDPPYTIDHYSRFYHVLETLCLYDEPSLAVMRKRGVPRLMRGLYRAGRHQSPFCVPSTVQHAFETLFDGIAGFDAPLVLSYSPNRSDGNQRPRLMNLPMLLAIAKKRFERVRVISVLDHAHRRLNADANNITPPSDAEVMLVCDRSING